MWAPHGAAARGKEVVLLVEPDAELRSRAASLLIREGYRVLEAQDAQEAIEIHRQHGTEIQLLLTDCAMPLMNGHELARLLGEAHPGLKVLYLADSDYGRAARRVAAERGMLILTHPFTVAALSQKVRLALDTPLLEKRTSTAS